MKTAPVAMPISVVESHPDYTRARYTLAHAAEYLVVSTKFLYGLVESKRIGHQRMSAAKNAKCFFSQAHLDAYAATRPHTVIAAPQRPRLVANDTPRRPWKIAQ